MRSRAVTDYRPWDVSGPGGPDPLASLSSTLWELRELLDMVCYLLTVERLLATAGESDYLHYAAQQLDVLTEQIRRTEIVRSAATETVAQHLGAPAAASLGELVCLAPTPWDDILTEHRDALVALSDRVAALRTRTEGALRAGAQAVADTLRAVEDRSRFSRTVPLRLDYRA